MKEIIYLTIVMLWFLFSLYWFLKGLKAKRQSNTAILGTIFGLIGMILTSIIACGIIENIF